MKRLLSCTFCTCALRFGTPPLFFVFETKSLKSFPFIFLLSYLSFLAFSVVSRSRGKPPFFFFSFSFLFPNFPRKFFFFCDEENKRRERLCKKRVFSRSEFLRTFYEVYGCIRAVFSTSLSRAVPSQRARVEGTGK